MAYLIDVLIMRRFDFQNLDYQEVIFYPECKEGDYLYSGSPIDEVMYDKTLEGDLIQCDMTQILLNQEKYRRLLGEANIQKLIDEMHPTPHTAMDGMTDEQRLDAVISRHCQTMSERMAVLSELASRHSELKSMVEGLMAENPAKPAEASAPAASE